MTYSRLFYIQASEFCDCITYETVSSKEHDDNHICRRVNRPFLLPSISAIPQQHLQSMITMWMNVSLTIADRIKLSHFEWTLAKKYKHTQKWWDVWCRLRTKAIKSQTSLDLFCFCGLLRVLLYTSAVGNIWFSSSLGNTLSVLLSSFCVIKYLLICKV